MWTLAWALIGAAALLLHEYLTSRSTLSARGSIPRRAVLVVLLVAASVAGPAVSARLDRWSAQAPAPVIPFDTSGDPLGSRAVLAQRPDQPFPAGQPRETVESWQRTTLARLAAHADLDLEEVPTIPHEALRSNSMGTVRRTLIRFTSWDGTRIPAYVFEPEGSTIKGAVLVVPGHGRGIESTAGFADEYQHAAALELARHGYLTLTPELRGFGLLSRSGVSSHRVVAAAALAAGSSYKAFVVRDLRRALSVLQSWKGVDPARVGVVGTSLGGELAVLLAAIDRRVRAVVSNSYGGAIGPAGEQDFLDDESNQTPHGCHTMPGINRIVLQEDWTRLVAPRPVSIVRGTRNTPETAAQFERLVAAAYQPFDAAARFELRIVPGGHEFYPEPTLAFLERWL